MQTGFQILFELCLLLVILVINVCNKVMKLFTFSKLFNRTVMVYTCLNVHLETRTLFSGQFPSTLQAFS